MTNGKLLACAFAAVGLVSIPRQASAIDRLTDQEMKKLFDTIEEDRSKFEGALDDKQKNTTIKDARGEVNANEFFDDFQDQVQRASDRFESDYSASSEVLSLLQYAVRLQGWTATQPAGFSASKEWGVLATDLRRLAAAYNTAMPNPGQQGLGSIAQARRINDAELVTAAANVEKKIDGFRSAYDSALADNTSITSETRQAAIPAGRLNEEICAGAQRRAGGQEGGGLGGGCAVERDQGHRRDGVEAPAEFPGDGVGMPLRDDLATIALAYEVTPASK